jgi:hypothetical protein
VAARQFVSLRHVNRGVPRIRGRQFNPGQIAGAGGRTGRSRLGVSRRIYTCRLRHHGAPRHTAWLKTVRASSRAASGVVGNATKALEAPLGIDVGNKLDHSMSRKH